MDAALLAAIIAAFSRLDRTTALVNGFLEDVVAAQDELEPILIEIFDLGAAFRRLREAVIPDQLQSPVTGVVRGCSDICKRIDNVLAGCGDGPHRSGRWALTDAPVEITELQRSLENSRATVQLVLEAVDEYVTDQQSSPGAGMNAVLTWERKSKHQSLADVEDLRGRLAPDSSTLDALLAICVDGVERFCVTTSSFTFLVDPSPSTPVTPTTPSMPEMLKTFRQTSLNSTEPALETVQDEELSEKQSKTSSPSRESRVASPPPLRLSQRTLLNGNGSPSHPYALFPPAAPPPTRALPPIPPQRSPRRPVVVQVLPAAATSNTHLPIETRKRAASDVTHDSKFSSLSSTASRKSAASNTFQNQAHVRSISYVHQEDTVRSIPETVSDNAPASFDLIPMRGLDRGPDKDSGAHGAVWDMSASPNTNIMATRHGKFHLKLWDLQVGCSLATIRIPFYVQPQARSREFFIKSHAILSQALNLVAISAGFGGTLEIWNWVAHKKVQTLPDAYRWAASRDDVFADTRCFPLAAYCQDEDAIRLYPVQPTASRKKPFGKPRVVYLRRASLPHVPRLPELAYSPTGPLLVAAAGPSPPRPNTPPPEHGALLMAWQLDGDARIHRPWRFHQPQGFPELENSLPLGLATYGSVAVSIWERSRFRTIGRPGMWQVEPVNVADRVVLVWDFGAEEDRTWTYSVPDCLSCLSPDCRFVAYCDAGGGVEGHGSLVILEAMSGTELWRLDGVSGSGRMKSASSASAGSSSLRRSSSSRSGGGIVLAGNGGLESLAALSRHLGKVTGLSFSVDGTRLIVGDADGNVSTFEIREGIAMAV